MSVKVPPVNTVLPEVEIKRLVAMRFDKLQGLVGEAIGDVLAVGPIGDVAELRSAASDPLSNHTIGREIARRTGVGCAVPGCLEPLLVWPVLGHEAEMPLPEVPGAIARIPEHLGDRHEVGIEVSLAVRIDQRLGRSGSRRIGRCAGLRGRPMSGCAGDPVARRVLPRQDRGSTRGAQRQGIGVGVPKQARGLQEHLSGCNYCQALVTQCIEMQADAGGSRHRKSA